MSPYCEWCGRAIRQQDGRWLAVKGVERGYDPVACEANTEDGLHEPAEVTHRHGELQYVGSDPAQAAADLAKHASSVPDGYAWCSDGCGRFTGPDLRRLWRCDNCRIKAVMAIDAANHATTSRDYGRGFAEAIRLVHELLTPDSGGSD